MSIESANIYDLLSTDGEAVLPTKTAAKDSKVEHKAAAPKQAKEHVKNPPVTELGKGAKTEDKAKRQQSKTGGGGDRPPREKPANPNKRVFDRRSGTGRGKETKKGGAGKGNWGNIESKDELAAESAPVEKEEAPKEPAEVSEEKTPAVTTAAPVEGEKVEEEEEDKTVSYEEWKAKTEVKPISLQAPVRQAGEGVDDSAWSEFVPLTREEEESREGLKKGLSGGEKKKKEPATGAATGAKVRVDEVFKIQVPQDKSSGIRRGGNKRPGAGGRDPSKSFRGGRGRPNTSGKNFSLNEEAFPSLSTKA